MFKYVIEYPSFNFEGELVWLSLMIGITVALFSIALYVLQAVGLLRMAKRCGVGGRVRAWFPVANAHLLGEIAELGAARYGGKKIPFRKVLMALQIVILSLAAAVWLFWGAPDGWNLSGIDLSPAEPLAMAAGDAVLPNLGFLSPNILLLVAVCLGAPGAIVVYAVFYFIALGYVYKLFDEQHAVLCLLLSVFISGAPAVIFMILGGITPKLAPAPATTAEAAPAATAPAATAPAATSAATPETTPDMTSAEVLSVEVTSPAPAETPADMPPSDDIPF